MVLGVRFALICEGTSDARLVSHLRDICVESGSEEAEGFYVDFARLPSPPKRDVSSRVRWVEAHEPSVNVIFVHRDADAREEDSRLSEIEPVARRARTKLIPVIPIQATEAWLLVDEELIRQVAAFPKGRMPLGMPPLAQIENVADPKRVLQEALAIASGLSGRRLQKFRQDFPVHRAVLIERIDRQGPVKTLRSWQRLLTRVHDAITC